MNNGTLPNFFIIGAAKSGTTALFDVLNQHPQVFFPFQKEPNFFSNDKSYSKGLPWYTQTYFCKNSTKYPARGEASPQYLYWSEKSSRRIAEIDKSQDIKIIAIFRDPVKRAYSHYWMLVHRELEDLSFADALEAEKAKLSENKDELEAVASLRYGYFKGGQYATLLQPFLEHFPLQNFRFLLLEDMKSDFSNMFLSLSDFLGIDNSFKFKPIKSNTAYKPRNYKLHHFLHHPEGPIYRIIRSVLKKTPYSLQYGLRRRIVDLNLKPSPNPPMDVDVENQLRARYLSENVELEKIINRNLDHWKIKSK